MEIYLVRHTETVCEKGICYGQSNVGLLEPYVEKFQSIKSQIPSGATIYSSPSLRCTLLADYLSDSNYTTDIRLMEMNFGDWEMKNWDDIPSDDFTPWMNDFVNVRVPNGEAFTDLYNRVVDFWDKELQNPTSKPVVIVAHAGVIRSVLCKISDLPLRDAFQNKVDFGSVVQISTL